MLLAEIEPMIAEIGLPYAYYAFTKQTAKAPPYVVYYTPGHDDLFADNINYQKILQLRIELYTKTKRYDIEAEVEEVLRDHEITYTVTEDFIESDGVFMITYDMEVLIHGSKQG